MSLPSSSNRAPLASALAVCLLCAAGCRGADDATLEVFAAASAGLALRAVADVHARSHPGVTARVELSGSQAAVHKLTQQRRVPDVLVSADAELLSSLLRTRDVRFVIRFASNRLVLAYNPKTPGGARLLAGEPWQTVLERSDVRFGIAAPEQAPVGYRALLALKLNDSVAPQPLRKGAAIAARVRRAQMRPDVTQLIAPLEVGELDAAFVYETEARGAGLPFVSLDPRIDFSDDRHAALYRSVKLDVGDGPDRRTVTGALAVYGLTIPVGARHPEQAAALIKTLLDEDGRAAAAAAGLPTFNRAAVQVEGELPRSLSWLP